MKQTMGCGEGARWSERVYDLRMFALLALVEGQGKTRAAETLSESRIVGSHTSDHGKLVGMDSKFPRGCSG